MTLTLTFALEVFVISPICFICLLLQVRCAGTSLFLKNKFGIGYHLTLVLDGKFLEPALYPRTFLLGQKYLPTFLPRSIVFVRDQQKLTDMLDMPYIFVSITFSVVPLLVVGIEPRTYAAGRSTTNCAVRPINSTASCLVYAKYFVQSLIIYSVVVFVY